MFENPRIGRQERNFTTNVPNSRSQIVFLTDIFRKLALGAPGRCVVDHTNHTRLLFLQAVNRQWLILLNPFTGFHKLTRGSN